MHITSLSPNGKSIPLDVGSRWNQCLMLVISGDQSKSCLTENHIQLYGSEVSDWLRTIVLSSSLHAASRRYEDSTYYGGYAKFIHAEMSFAGSQSYASHCLVPLVESSAPLR